MPATAAELGVDPTTRWRTCTAVTTAPPGRPSLGRRPSATRWRLRRTTRAAAVNRSAAFLFARDPQLRGARARAMAATGGSLTARSVRRLVASCAAPLSEVPYWAALEISRCRVVGRRSSAARSISRKKSCDVFCTSRMNRPTFFATWKLVGSKEHQGRGAKDRHVGNREHSEVSSRCRVTAHASLRRLPAALQPGAHRLKIIYTRGNRTETLASIATLRKILNRFVATGSSTR